TGVLVHPVRRVPSSGGREEGRAVAVRQRFLAAAFPPLRPAAFFCAVVPPCLELLPLPDDFPPRLEEPGELAILAARCLDIPLSFSASYCFSFFTLGRLFGMASPFVRDPLRVEVDMPGTRRSEQRLLDL